LKVLLQFSTVHWNSERLSLFLLPLLLLENFSEDEGDDASVMENPFQSSSVET
jgi:hypothetical protein